ncbi:hypothetical protein QVD17_25157 [Tagetes erecta]|uniref:PUM-HD domain-containing protein n=1 Tax=Tagetes erecta TaxID=13708 RepID=A0AAD8KMB7_TARER|nr:hypothetical protein QVD17_25157 [Tagetes erecta]
MDQKIPPQPLTSHPLSPELLINTPEVPITLPSSTNVDQNLSNSLSSLNISCHNHTNRQTFIHQIYNNPYVVRQRSPLPVFRKVYTRVYSSDPSMVHPHLYRHQYASYSPASASSGSGFDPRVHLDYESYLRVNELVSSSSDSDESSIRSKNVNTPSDSRTLEDLKKEICFLAKDQCGSKYLKSKFVSPTEVEIEIVLSEVKGSIAELMKHQFGNQLIQKLICVCNDDQKARIVCELTEITFEFIDVCMSPYGTKAVQKLLGNLKSPNQIMMVIRALRGGAARLANDPNGHHVLEYCLKHFDSDFNQLILDRIADNCFEVATNRSGCCVMQACVEHSHGEVRNRLVYEILINAIQLAEDPFGNYVLQHMVQLKSVPQLTELLVRQLQGKFANLSQNKYASNVVEKCLTESRPIVSEDIILELVESANASSLLVDPYGNFVIQSALKVSKGFAYDSLLNLISRNVTSMQSNIYGKKILERIERKRIVYS